MVSLMRQDATLGVRIADRVYRVTNGDDRKYVTVRMDRDDGRIEVQRFYWSDFVAIIYAGGQNAKVLKL